MASARDAKKGGDTMKYHVAYYVENVAAILTATSPSSLFANKNIFLARLNLILN